MATAKSRYTADINLGVTPEMKAQLSDIAWKNRTSMRELIRTFIGTEIAIRVGINHNDRARELFVELLNELGIDERKAAEQ